jgi:hypothetical protein
MGYRTFDLTNGDVIIDTRPHVNVCNCEGE